MQNLPPRSPDECLWHLRHALRGGRLDDWEKGFTLGVMKQSKRNGWRPSEKQLRVMRRVVAELAEPDTVVLVDG